MRADEGVDRGVFGRERVRARLIVGIIFLNWTDAQRYPHKGCSQCPRVPRPLNIIYEGGYASATASLSHPRRAIIINGPWGRADGSKNGARAVSRVSPHDTPAESWTPRYFSLFYRGARKNYNCLAVSRAILPLGITAHL